MVSAIIYQTTIKKIYITTTILTALIITFFWHKDAPQDIAPIDGAPVYVTLAGDTVCLPFIDTKAVPGAECIFGLKTDDGVYYMVNFGQSASLKEWYDKREHITAEGYVVPKEALSTNRFVPYNMKGIFTITKFLTVSN